MFQGSFDHHFGGSTTILFYDYLVTFFWFATRQGRYPAKIASRFDTKYDGKIEHFYLLIKFRPPRRCYIGRDAKKLAKSWPL